jgi:hypothetical protein
LSFFKKKERKNERKKYVRPSGTEGEARRWAFFSCNMILFTFLQFVSLLQLSLWRTFFLREYLLGKALKNFLH